MFCNAGQNLIGSVLPLYQKAKRVTQLFGITVRGHPEYIIKRAIADDCRDERNQADNADKVMEYNAIHQHNHACECTNGTIFLPHIFLHGCSVKVDDDQDCTFWPDPPNDPLRQTDRQHKQVIDAPGTTAF